MKLSESDFRRLLDISSRLNKIKDLDLLLEKTLYELRQITNADAGSIYLVKNRASLSMEFVQNDSLQRQHLKEEFYHRKMIPINESSFAGYVAKNKKVLNIPDAYETGRDTCGFNRRFDEMTGYRTRSVLTIPMLIQDNVLVGVVQVINARDLNDQITTFSQFHALIASVFATQAATSIARSRMTHGVLLRMIKLSELRDPRETGEHVRRVAAYSVVIYENWARKHRIPAQEIEKNKDLLKIAAMLHDIGKVAISDLILKKKERLEVEEFERMQQHTLLGAKIFDDSDSELEIMARDICLHHHERWDGTGYPGSVPKQKGFCKRKGKRGTEIPFFARIVALADVYDALSSSRSYKKGWDPERIKDYIRNQRGAHFDPELVDVFIDAYEDIRYSVRQMGPRPTRLPG